MKVFTSKTQKIGELGENICISYLNKKDHKIIERNYTKKTGEIDIIVEKNNIIHFIEVKSIKLKKVPYETYNPAENLTKKKYFKIYKTILIYLSENNVSSETKWQIDLYCVYIDTINNHHKLTRIEDVVII